MIDFKDLCRYLHPHTISILTTYSPGGELVGQEYCAATVYGGHGQSFKYNINTHRWADFNSNDHKGIDIIALVSAIKNIKPYAAATLLASEYGYITTNDVRIKPPSFVSNKYGPPTNVYLYRNEIGFNTHAVVRYDLKEKNSKGKNKKTFSQWHFDESTGSWIAKTTETKPLYNLDFICKDPNKKIVICEGEKSAEAAQKILGSRYTTTCWMGGCQKSNIKKTNLSPLNDRDIILWPDSDSDHAGLEAMQYLMAIITPTAKSIVMIEPQPNDPDSFDAADLLEQGLGPDQIKEWFTKRRKQFKPLMNQAVHVEAEVDATPLASSKGYNSTSTAPTLNIVDTTPQVNQIDLPKAIVKWHDYGLQFAANSRIFHNELNIYIILTKHHQFKDHFAFDVFHQRYIYFTDASKTEYKIYSEEIEVDILMFLQCDFFMGNLGLKTVTGCLTKILKNAPRVNTEKDKIARLAWDGIPRVDTFLVDIYGATPSNYITAASKIFWLQLVKRICEPGCQADIVIILEGAQGIRKTTSLRIIGGENYAVAGKDVTSKDFYIKLKGKSLVEIGELNTFSKADHNDLKEAVSTTVDQYRDLFAKQDTPHPRTCVMVGTTNDKHYLKDETGNRRYLPVECEKADTDLLKQNLDQYYAEAYNRLNLGESHWEYPADEHEKLTSERFADLKEDDPWYDDIIRYVGNKQSIDPVKFLTDPSIDGGLGMYSQYIEVKHMRRVWKVLKQLGFERKNIRDGNKVKKVWVLK